MPSSELPSGSLSPRDEVTLTSGAQTPNLWHEKATHRDQRRRQSADPETLSRQLSRRSSRSRRTPRWWKIRLFKGMIDDVKRRAPFYLSDFTDAWDYRVIPATVYMYFAKSVEYHSIESQHQPIPSLPYRKDMS